MEKSVFGYKVVSKETEPLNLKKVALNQSVPFKTIFKLSKQRTIVYGLASNEKVDSILVKGTPASIVPLEMFSNDLNAKKLRLWYANIEEDVDIDKEIEVIPVNHSV